MNTATGLVKSFINLIYPLHCASCGNHLDSANKSGSCDICLSGVKRNPAPYCRVCGRSAESAIEQCPECRKMSPVFSSAHSACLYEGSLKEFIHKFKYNNRRELSGILTKLMLDYINNYPGTAEDVDAITFVPLHKKRAIERSFNQSEILASIIGKELNMPVIGCLEKKLSTKNQNELSRENRLVNVQGAFGIKTGAEDTVKGLRLLLIDDVMTTGATLNEASRVLADAGAADVRCLTLARGV